MTFSRASIALADEAVEVTVRGSSSGGYVSRSGYDDTPREPVDASAILEELPSVHIRRLGGEGSFAQISVRGSASSEVGAFIAGIPVTSAADPAVDVAQLPLWPGATYRVYRGFAPASLGTTGYLGGVVSVDAPSAALGDRTSWFLAAGSFGSMQMRAGDARRIGDVTIAGGVYAARSDGDATYEVADPKTNALVELTRKNAGYASAGLIERVAIEKSWGTLGLLALVDGRRAGVPGTVLAPAAFASLETSRAILGVDATTKAHGSSLRFAAWGRRETSRVDDPEGELTRGGRGTSDDRVSAAGASATWFTLPFDGLRLALLADLRDEAFSPVATEGAPMPSANRLAGGAGAEIDLRAGERLTFNASGRVDLRDDTGGGAAARGEAAPNGHVGASFRVAREATVSMHAGALERPPSFLELFGNGGSILGDATLAPERALSVDLGVQGAIDERAVFSYEVVGFATKARDLIAFVPYGRNTFRATDIDAATLGGLEVVASLSAKGLRSQISYTLLGTRNDSGLPDENGRPLPGRPVHDLSYDATYRFGLLHLRYGLDAIAGTTLDASGAIVLPARVLHSAGAAVDLAGTGARLGVDVENLFDLRTLSVRSPLLGSVEEPLSDFIGYPLPGRALWISLRWDNRAALR